MKNLNLVTVERIHLWYYNAYENSDKVYNIELHHNPTTNLYSVYFEYGRRTKKLVPGYKVQEVSREKATYTMESLKSSKERKGYDLQTWDRNMKAINIQPYINLARKLGGNGILTQTQTDRIIQLLESGEPSTVIMATEILSAKQSKIAA